MKIIFVDNHRPAPVLINNKGVKLDRGSRLQITPEILKARDIDSNDASLVYSIAAEGEEAHGKT